MHIAILDFAKHTEVSPEEQYDAISSLFGALRRNGQILGDELQTASAPGRFQTRVLLPAIDALDHCHDNQYVSSCYAKLPSSALAPPSITLVGLDPDSRESCKCQQHTSLILFTTFLHLDSPLRCGDCFDPIPLYTLPPDKAGDYSGILRWESDYKACDTLQIGCTTGERFALREMSNPSSSLSQQGRAVCKQIEKDTGLKAYYYLHRSGGRSDHTERLRKCPSCGGDWALTEPIHRIFDFRCDECRLLSNISFDFRP